ncbi:MAG TPA: hypothetical protein VFH90_02230, partial [Candidatus Limnocylindria bacterium]|nr:hypothetical protein [Candidatus Limnocylindria bacterium]
MRSLWAAAFLLRRLRGETAIALLIVTLVAATSFVFAAGPRLLDRVSDDGLRHELRSTGPVQRNLQLSTVSTLSGAEGSFDAIRSLGEDFEGEMADVLRVAIDERLVTFTTVRFHVADPPIYDTYISLRYQSGLDDEVELTDGRMPASTGDALSPPSFGINPSPDPEPGELPVFEIAVSDATAAEIGVAVGDVLLAAVDESDPLIRRSFFRSPEARFEVVGIYTVDQPDSERWYGERALQVVNVGGTLDSPIAFATAMVAPETLDGLVDAGLPIRYAWRYLIEPDRLDAGQIDALIVALQRLETTFGSTGTDAALANSVVLRTGLLDAIDRYQSQRAATEAVLSVAAIGPFALAAGAVGMIGILLVSRRRPSLDLARGRGASGWLLIGAQVWEGLLLAAPPALAGWAIASLVVPGRASTTSSLLGMSVGLAAAFALVLATWPAVRQPYGAALGRDEAPPLRASPRRLVLEATAVLLAVSGTLLLRQRGLALDDEVAHFDPFLAAVPVLATVAVGIVLLRVYPLPIRVGGWLAARRRDLVPVLGLRSVGRHAGAVSLPLLVLMLTAAFSAFTSVVMATVDHGQADASWEQVGADYRIDTISGAGLSSRVDPTAIEGVDGFAYALVDPSAPFTIQDRQRTSIYLHAPDLEGYREVIAEGPLRAEVPEPMLTPSAGTAGTPERPLPAIISRRMPAGGQPLNPGDVFVVTVRGQPISMEVAAIRNQFPGVPEGLAFVVSSLDQLQAAYRNPPLLPSTAFVRGSADIEASLAATFREQSTSIRMVSRHARYRAMLDAPLVAAIGSGFRLTMLVSAAYTAIAG